MAARTTPEDFWARVEIQAGCWPWRGQIDRYGYGKLKYQGNHWKAHRLAMMLFGNPVPAGKFACHRCHNRLCCRPSHLYAGDAYDNMRDMVAAGRRKGPDNAGARHPQGKVTLALARRILAARRRGDTCTAIGRRLGISRQAVSEVVNHQHWTTKTLATVQSPECPDIARSP